MEKLLQGLRAEPVSAEAYEAVADHLMGLGYAGLAARWRSWALLPPEASQREAAVADLEWRLAAGKGGPEGLRPLPPGSESDPQLLLQRAQALLQQGAQAEAREVVTHLALLSGLPADLCHQAGLLAREAGEPALAERWIRTGLQQAPDNAIAWFTLARVLADLEAWDETLAAAEQGLRVAPRHPWGRKLRWLALENTGAPLTLTRVAQLDGLPDLSRLPAQLPRLERQRRRLERFRGQAPAALALALRVELHRRLIERPPLWVVMHGAGEGALALARNADLLPPGLRIQPLASRDPIRLQQALAPYPAEILPERPAVMLGRLPPPGLVVLHRASRPALPLVLRGLLDQGVPFLAPIGLLSPGPEHGEGMWLNLLRRNGWELLWPECLTGP